MTNLGASGLTGALASGYHGPPELTVTRALTEWTLDPWMLALILVLGGGYLLAARRARRVPGGWPVARPIWFCGLGLGFLVIATLSWVGVYQPVLFYARAVQTVLLVLVVPLFLALGRPVTLFAAVFPRAGARLNAGRPLLPARVLTFPAITTFALIGVPFVMYFTSWYTWVFRSTTVRELTFVALMIPGFVFFWTLLRVDPVPKEYAYAVAMWITGAEVIGDAFFGIAVIADQNLLGAAYYHALARPWGPSLATDQVLGGGVLWILGDLVGPAVPRRAADPHDARRRVGRGPDRRRAGRRGSCREAKVQALSSPAEPGAPATWATAEPGAAGPARPRTTSSPCGGRTTPASPPGSSPPAEAGPGLDRAPDEQRPAAGQFLVPANSCAFITHQDGTSV